MENLGKKVRFILSFDDFDRFKKVPRGVDESYEKFVGMPNYSFPSHVDNTIGYAKYYENKIIEQLELLGIEMECIYQSEKYLKNDKYFNGDVGTVGVFKTFKKIFPNLNISLLDNRVSLEDGKNSLKNADIIYLLGGNPFIQLLV